jgi:hypothetical protein
MTIPPPPPQHRLSAGISRFAFHLKRTEAYLAAVKPGLATAPEAEENRQYCFQTIVLMLHTFLEEHYRILLSTATFYRAEDVRDHLAKRYHEHAKTIEEMPAPELMRRVQKEVAFGKDSKKLKSIFQLLFAVEPFADSDAESKCLDLVRVRNIITHQGGLVDEADVSQLASPTVVVQREGTGQLVFYKLSIQPEFFSDVLHALGRSVAKIDEGLKQDPRYVI